MHRLRNARHLACLVLAWFALALLVAVASPLVRGETLEVVCAGAGGMKLLAHDQDGTAPAGGHNMQDCQLCAALAGPPPVQRTAIAPPSQLAHALRPLVAVRLAWLASAPLPARGPPPFS